VELPLDAEPRGAIVPAGPISYVTLLCSDLIETVHFYRDCLGIDAEPRDDGRYLFSRGNGGVCLIAVEDAAAVDRYPQPLLNHHGITLYSGREELIDALRKNVESQAAAFGVKKVLPATYQHGSYSFYMQDRDTNWWEIEILEELDAYAQTIKDGEWTADNSDEMGARFARTARTADAHARRPG
jgi:catechol-2,3-dioxygenase